jgi:hypothetical protein
MRCCRHEYILLAAFLACVATWFCFRDYSFSIDAAASATYTVIVFLHAFRKRGRLLIHGKEARSVSEIIFAHTVCVASLVLILRTGMFISVMPDWLTLPVIGDHYGRLGPSLFQILQALGASFLGYFEWKLLISPRTVNVEKEERKARTALWKKAEVEAERMDNLRLPWSR